LFDMIGTESMIAVAAMKSTLGVILLLSIALPSFAELTQQDLDEISALIDRNLEPIKLTV